MLSLRSETQVFYQTNDGPVKQAEGGGEKDCRSYVSDNV